jgi:hypothetical protein
MLAAGAVVGLLIPLAWFGLYSFGSEVFVPHIFNMQWHDYLIFAIWPSFLLLLVMNQSAVAVGAISVLLNIILYALYGYALAAIWSRLRN